MKALISRREFIVGTGALAATAIVPMEVSQAMDLFFTSAVPAKISAVKCYEDEYRGVRSTIVAVGESASNIVGKLDIRSDFPYFQAPEIILINEPKSYENLILIAEKLRNLHWMILVADEGDGNLSQVAVSLLRMAKQSGVMLTTLVYSHPSKKNTDSDVANSIRSASLSQFSDSTIIVPSETEFHNGKDELFQLAIEDLIAVFAKTGLIGVDFTDLKEIFSKGRLFYFGSGTGSSHKESWDSALNSPLLNEGHILQTNSLWAHMSHSCDGNELILLLDLLEQTLGHETDMVVCSGIDESLRDVVRVSIYCELI